MAEPSKKKPNHACDSCQRNEAKVSCACTGSKLYLCSDCIVVHTTEKYHNLLHQLVPASIEVASLSKFQERSDSFGAGKAELEANLAAIDLCCSELTEAFDSVIARLAHCRDYYLNEFQAWKATLAEEIEAAVAEVRTSLAHEEVTLVNKYSAFLRNFRPGNLVLFRYTIDISEAENFVQSIARFQYPQPTQEPTRQEQTQVPQQSVSTTSVPTDRVVPASNVPAAISAASKLVRLKKKKADVFNFSTLTWDSGVRLEKEIVFDDCSRYTLVDEERVFCCGCHLNSSIEERRAAFLIKFSQGTVEDLPPLRIARITPGVLHHRNRIFVFGCKSHAARDA